MAHRKLKGVLDKEGKCSSHDSSGSQSLRQKRISDLEILVQRLQNRLRFHTDPMAMEDLVGENKIEEEHGDEEEEIVRPSQLRNFLECKKAKDKHVRDYDYLRRYDGRYHDGDYYERRGNYDEGSRFTPRLDIPEFEGRMYVDDFLDCLNMVERVFEYCDPPEYKRVK